MRLGWLGFLVIALACSGQALASAKFPRPQELESDVRFWKRVYTEVDTNGGLIHDARHLDVVYREVRFPESLSRRERSRRVRRIKRHYRDILTRLARGDRRNLTAEERRVLELWPDNVSDRTLRRARHRLRFQLGQADRFRAGLVRSGRWEPFIRTTLREMGLPTELAALPHVESSFNPDAYSRVGAAGLWQFTRTTGRRYLRIDHVVDERLDPYKATVAAARLLEHNRRVTGSWPLALTAYNHGAAGMRRAARQVGTRDIATIVRNYDSRTFGFASRNFYVAFLAALDVSRNAEAHFGGLDRDPPVAADTVRMPAFMSVSTLRDVYGVDRDTLRRYNRGLRDAVWAGHKLVPRGYDLRVPEGAGPADGETLLASVPDDAIRWQQRASRVHVVQRGQTLSEVARRYGVGVYELVRANNLRSAHYVRAGQRLRLPGTRRRARVQNGVYTVRRGDTLYDLADRFGVPAERLARANDLTDKHRIYPGQPLRVARFDARQPDGAGTRSKESAASADGSDDNAAVNDRDMMASAADLDASATDADADDDGSTESGRGPGTGAASEASGGEQPLERAVVASESAEPTSAAAAEAIGPAQPSVAQVDLSADPSDYSVADDGTIEVQAAETLGHYAEWLGLRASRLRRVNGMRYGEPLIIGERLALDFSEVGRDLFEQRRRAYHRLTQRAFFERFRISGTEARRVRRGDSLWTIADDSEHVPVWLLRQYNPDLEAADLRPGMTITMPRVSRRDQGEPAPVRRPPRRVAQACPGERGLVDWLAVQAERGVPAPSGGKHVPGEEPDDDAVMDWLERFAAARDDARSC